jgi:hypothetical protein
MKAVKKYTTFNSLKATETIERRAESDSKKHTHFQKVIMEVRASKKQQTNQSQTNP